MLVESKGNPQAKSPVGSVGLMQIMPRTAELIAKERGLPDHSIERLWDPAYNIDFGAYYLAQQQATFGTDDPAESIELTAAAYNGGPKRVRSWLQGEAELSAETNYYKELVAKLWSERNLPNSPTLDKR